MMFLPACCEWCCNPKHRKRSRVVLYFRLYPNAVEVHAARILDVDRANLSMWHSEAVARGCVPPRRGKRRKGPQGVPPAGLRTWTIGAIA